jgi:putative tricarboxylic transport membrane protein
MKEQGYDIEYLMLRGIFGAPDISKEAQDWYIYLLKKVTETPEWVEFTDKGGLKRAFLTGQDFILYRRFQAYYLARGAC